MLRGASRSPRRLIRMNDCQLGKHRAIVKLYATGRILVQGADSPLREGLIRLKHALEAGLDPLESSSVLPAALESRLTSLSDRIPEMDTDVLTFLDKAMLTMRVGAYRSAAFLLGAASEKAIGLMFDAYLGAIEDPARRHALENRMTHHHGIAARWEAFYASWKSSRNHPPHLQGESDMQAQIAQTFHFARICRNEVGHPHMPVDLDAGLVSGNLAAFAKYLEAIYAFIAYYREHSVAF